MVSCSLERFLRVSCWVVWFFKFLVFKQIQIVFHNSYYKFIQCNRVPVSESSPTPAVKGFINMYHPYGYEIVSHCDLNLHLSYWKPWCTFFHVYWFSGYPFWWMVSSELLPFINWVILVCCWLVWRFSVPWILPFTGYILYEYVLICIFLGSVNIF